MDHVSELERAFRKHTAAETPRPPLVPAEKNNALITTTTTTRRPRTREVSSRYKSPSRAGATPTLSSPRRCPSPNLTRTVPTPSHLVPKRAQSVDRKRPSTPTSPKSPSTPVQDSSVDTTSTSRRLSTGRLPESLWPSTMRSLSVSFQSDTISIPVSKKEKPVTNALSDRTLRPSSNVAHKQQVETPAVTRKPTPERKRSPLKGKNTPDQSENYKPVDGLHTRLIDQHRWPSRIGGRVSSNALSRSNDFVDKTVRNLATPVTGIGLSNLRRLSTSDVMVKPLEKSVSDCSRLLSLEDGGRGFGAYSVDNSPHASGPQQHVSTGVSDKLTCTTSAVRSQAIPSTGLLRYPSPIKTSSVSSPVHRGVSPSRSRPSTPPSRGVSPSRPRPSSSCGQSSNPNSVLSFIADFRKGKKGTGYIEDAHHLRLLYNRYLQWRFANAQAEDVLYIQKVTAERTLYNVWNATLSLWDSVIRKRINLQQMKLELKLNSVLNNQMAYLDNWAAIERDHIASLSGAVEDLEASTLRLPVAGGARADIDALKVAICAAVDVMQAMASSICSLLPRVEGMNSLVSELAIVAAQEKAMLNQCEALLASTVAMQVEEYSLRTHLVQTNQSLGRVSSQFWHSRHLYNPD